MESLKDLLKILLPNGLGTRAILAMAVVGGAVGLAIYVGAEPTLKELALLVIGFYFGNKAGNGESKQ